MITPDKYQEIADWLKIGKFYGGGNVEQGPYKDFGYGDKFLEIINIARILRQPLRKIYNDSIVPLKTDKSIDTENLAKHVRDISNVKGIKGLLVNGHAGENFTLSANEQNQVLKIILRKVII